jgi:hypothetical protein
LRAIFRPVRFGKRRSPCAAKQRIPSCRVLTLNFGRFSSPIRCKEIVTIDDLPDDLSFVYFGLYDVQIQGSSGDAARVGFYLAGGCGGNPVEAMENGKLSYFPGKRRLQVDLLDQVQEGGRKIRESQELSGHLLVLAAAAILARSAVIRLALRLPSFVGFDSGDYIQVNRVNG